MLQPRLKGVEISWWLTALLLVNFSLSVFADSGDLCRFGVPPLDNYRSSNNYVSIDLDLPEDVSPGVTRNISGATVNGDDGTLYVTLDDSSDQSPPLIVSAQIQFGQPAEVFFVVELQGFQNVEAITWMYDSTVAVFEEHLPGISIIDLSDAAIIQSSFPGDYRIISKEPGRNQAILQSFTIQYTPQVVQAGITGMAYDAQRGAFYAVDELTPKTIQEIQSDGFAFILRDVHTLVAQPGSLSVFEVEDLSELWMDAGSKTLVTLSSTSRTVTQFGTTEDVFGLKLLSGLNLDELEGGGGSSRVPKFPTALSFIPFTQQQQYAMVVGGNKKLSMWLTDCVDPREPGAPDSDTVIRTCGNGVKDGLETGIDCGGFGCSQCPGGQPCQGPSDCASRNCYRNSCTGVGAQETLPPAPELSPYSPRPSASPTVLGDGDTPSPTSSADYTPSPTSRNTSPTASPSTPADIVCSSQNDAGCPETLGCVRGECVDESSVSKCTNGRKDPTESDRDCGGSCPPCGPGRQCQADQDCLVGLTCSITSETCKGAVVGPQGDCYNGKRDAAEEGVDCGGPLCMPCPTVECVPDSAGDCPTGKECLRGSCIDKSSVDRCSNGQLDGSETDLDCGGACPPCGPTQVCDTNNDCLAGLECAGDAKVCKGGLTGPQQGCFNGVLDGDEQALDCGGEFCAVCPPGGGGQVDTPLDTVHGTQVWYLGLVAAGLAIGVLVSSIVAREQKLRRRSQARYEDMP